MYNVFEVKRLQVAVCHADITPLSYCLSLSGFPGDKYMVAGHAQEEVCHYRMLMFVISYIIVAYAAQFVTVCPVHTYIYTMVVHPSCYQNEMYMVIVVWLIALLPYRIVYGSG